MGNVVLSEHRRGLGRAFLARVVTAARAHERPARAGVEEGDEAGEAFAARYGLRELRARDLSQDRPRRARADFLRRIEVVGSRSGLTWAMRTCSRAQRSRRCRCTRCSRCRRSSAGWRRTRSGRTSSRRHARRARGGRVIGFVSLHRRAADRTWPSTGSRRRAESHPRPRHRDGAQARADRVASRKRLPGAPDVDAGRERAHACDQRQARVRAASRVDPLRGPLDQVEAALRGGEQPARPPHAVAALASYVEVWNAITPDEPTTVEQQRDRRERDPRRLYLLAESDIEAGGGFAGPSDSPAAGSSPLGCCPTSVAAAPARRSCAELVTHLGGLGFGVVVARGRCDAGSLACAHRFGFEEVDRQVEQVRVVGDEARPAPPDGVELVSVAERPELLADRTTWPWKGTPTWRRPRRSRWRSRTGSWRGDAARRLLRSARRREVVGFCGLCRSPRPSRRTASPVRRPGGGAGWRRPSSAQSWPGQRKRDPRGRDLDAAAQRGHACPQRAARLRLPQRDRRRQRADRGDRVLTAIGTASSTAGRRAGGRGGSRRRRHGARSGRRASRSPACGSPSPSPRRGRAACRFWTAVSPSATPLRISVSRSVRLSLEDLVQERGHAARFPGARNRVGRAGTRGWG